MDDERKVQIALTEAEARVLVRLVQVTVEHIRDFDAVQREIGQIGGQTIIALYEQRGIYLPAEREQSCRCPMCGHLAHPSRVCLADVGAAPCSCDHGLATGTRYDAADRPYRARAVPAAILADREEAARLEAALAHAHALVKRLAYTLSGMIALVKHVGERPGMSETCRGAVRKAQAALREVPALLLEDLGIKVSR